MPGSIPVCLITSSASSAIVNSPGLPRLTGPVTSSPLLHHRDETVDQVIDVAERPGLLTVAVDRDGSCRSRALMMKFETTRPSCGCMRGP